MHAPPVSIHAENHFKEINSLKYYYFDFCMEPLAQ